jgi:hypothetical protein
MSTSNTTIILPIKSSKTKDFSDFFSKLVESIQKQKVLPTELIIVPTAEESLQLYLTDYDFGDLQNIVKIETYEGEPSFQAQVNYGVSKATNEWVSFCEFDDEYSAIWFKNVEIYKEAYPDSQAFLPVVVDVDDKNQFAGFTNEATFAANFNLDYGIVTNELLARFQNFQSSGMVIKKETFLDYGGFKESMKLTFVYEFLMRMTYNSAIIRTIPKIGYKHTNMRLGSIFWNYKFGESPLSPDEAKFWLEVAKKEYFFIQDREIKYEPELVDESNVSSNGN